jgi:hypothetical protein
MDILTISMGVVVVVVVVVVSLFVSSHVAGGSCIVVLLVVEVLVVVVGWFVFVWVDSWFGMNEDDAMVVRVGEQLVWLF